MRAEEQTADTRVIDDRLHDIRHRSPRLLVRPGGGHSGLGGSGDICDHPVKNRADELVLVGEALVEIPSGQARPSANRTDSEDTVRMIGAEQVEPGVQKSASAQINTLGRLYSAIRADLGNGGHLAILTAVKVVRQYLITGVLTFKDRQVNGDPPDQAHV